MRQHFWFLDILVSGMRLHTLCKLAVAALVPALTVPGLVVARVRPERLPRNPLVVAEAPCTGVLDGASVASHPVSPLRTPPLPQANAHVIGGLLVAQAVLISLMEEKLYAAGHEEGAPEPMYPGEPACPLPCVPARTH